MRPRISAGLRSNERASASLEEQAWVRGEPGIRTIEYPRWDSKPTHLAPEASALSAELRGLTIAIYQPGPGSNKGSPAARRVGHRSGTVTTECWAVQGGSSDLLGWKGVDNRC